MYQEKNHLPFCAKLAENLDDLDDRIFKQGKAALLIIDGGVGEGKTTLAVHCGDYVNKKHGREEIDIQEKKQLAMGGVQFTQKLRIVHKEGYPVLIYDEAGDFSKRGSLTRFNAMLNRTFETYRAFKVLVIICLPNVGVLDQNLFDNNIPRLTLHCRGRTPRQGHIKGYSLYRTLYIRERMKKLTVKAFAYQIVDPNFYAHFKDLTPERSRQLDKVSTEGKIKELEKAEIKIEGLISYKEICQRLARSINWVRQAIKALKIRHVKVIEKRKYFDAGVIDVMADYADEQAANANPGRKEIKGFATLAREEAERKAQEEADNAKD